MNEPIVIFPWMIQELHLKGAALLVFALWYAERRDRPVQELAELLDLTERGVRKVLPKVQEAKEQSSLKKEQSSENWPKKEQSSKNEKERTKEKEKKIINYSLVDLRIDDASHDATNAKKNLTIDERKNLFWNRLLPYVQSGKYTREMVENFYYYWTECNEQGRRMRFEMEKIFELPRRLATWKKRDDARNSHPKIGGVPAGGGSMIRSLSPEQLQEQLLSKRRREEDTNETLRKYDADQKEAISWEEMQQLRVRNSAKISP